MALSEAREREIAWASQLGAAGLAAMQEQHGDQVVVVTAKPPRSIYDVIAEKAGRLAAFTDKAIGIAKAIKYIVIAGESYAREIGVAPKDLAFDEPTARHTADGIVFTIAIKRRQ